jgi:tRNA U34 5-methylaminomethyl-2-thiouridine-forming methyltransferase MnmC
MEDVEIILTSDGSHSILNKSLQETYHSRHGALQESTHVFIRNGLDYFTATKSAEEIRILEVGFGTGLNALLTLEQSIRHHIKITYTTLEPYPLGEQVWKKLNYIRDRDDLKDFFYQLHLANWEVSETINPHFILHKTRRRLQELSPLPNHFHLVYFDAFAPNKQPEMWELEWLAKVVNAMIPGGTLVTYCAKGQLKRDLRSLDMLVETLPGPPGKKEMVRAIKQDR